MNNVKHLGKMEAVPSDLSSGGRLESNQDSGLEFELELELLYSEPRVGS